METSCSCRGPCTLSQPAAADVPPCNSMPTTPLLHVPCRLVLTGAVPGRPSRGGSKWQQVFCCTGRGQHLQRPGPCVCRLEALQHQAAHHAAAGAGAGEGQQILDVCTARSCTAQSKWSAAKAMWLDRMGFCSRSISGGSSSSCGSSRSFLSPTEY